MELQIVIDKIVAITNSQNAVLRLYPILGNDGQEIVKLADLTDEAADELKGMLLENLNDKFVNNPDLYFTTLTQADDRNNAAYDYDILEKPTTLQLLSDILNQINRESFSFQNDSISSITGFVILIGDEVNRITLYKRHYHLNTMRANKSFSIFRSAERFVKVNEDILKLSRHVDFLQIDESLIVCDLDALEKTFGFEDVIRQQAQTNIDFIQGLNLLEDVAPLVEMALELKQAKRILKIKQNSPVTQLPIATVISFVKNHKPIMKKFRLSEDGSKLKLDTQVSRKLFLALMNDDLLTSELTQLYYAGVAKDKMDVDDEEVPEV